MTIQQDILKADSGLMLKNSTLSDVKKLYRQLKNMIGFSLPESNEDLNDICKSIQQVYGSWRFNEILLAVQLSIEGTIQAKITTYGSLTANHLSAVIQEYRAVKSETILKYRRTDNCEEELTQEQKDQIVIDGINRNYRNFLSDPSSLLNNNFFWSHYISFLTRTGRLDYTEEDLQNYREQAGEFLTTINPEELHRIQGRVGRDFRGRALEDATNSQIKDKLTWYLILLDYFNYCQEKSINPV